MVCRKNVFTDKKLSDRLKSARELKDISKKGIKKKAAKKKEKKDKGWKVFMAVQIPPFRNYSAMQVAKEVSLGRGWKGRSIRALGFAELMGLETMVSKEMFDETSPLFIQEVVDHVKSKEEGMRVF